jgi:UDP-N-acetylmuramate--alanine ligase
MTNVDGDHFDAFDDLEDYQNAYREFLDRLPKDGVLITHMSDPDCTKVATASGGKTLDADLLSFPDLSVPGYHMKQNAQLVSALADHLGIDARESLKKFTGTWRRFEVKGETEQGAIVIDDYAHHPVEIVATIATAREKYPDRRLVCLFQPHTHDRTLRFYDDFLNAFDSADLVVTTDVYDARPEIENESVDIKKYTADIHADSIYGGSLDQAKEELCCSILQQDDVLLVMGAGDITRVASQLVR